MNAGDKSALEDPTTTLLHDERESKKWVVQEECQKPFAR